MTAQGFARIDVLLSAIALVNFDLLLPIRGKGCLDLFSPASGFCSMGPLLLALELAMISLEFLLMIQSFGCAGLLLPAVDATSSGPPMVLQSPA